MVSSHDILGLPWPVARKILDAAQISYRVFESFAPRDKVSGASLGLVSRVRMRATAMDIVLTYPVFEPNSPDLLTSRGSDTPGETKGEATEKR